MAGKKERKKEMRGEKVKKAEWEVYGGREGERMEEKEGRVREMKRKGEWVEDKNQGRKDGDRGRR